MEKSHNFVNYYDILQVNPGCDARILEIAYHYFAKMYHPDNPETGDTDKFSQLIEIYGVLRDPAKRADYDRMHFGDDLAGMVAPEVEGEIDESAAISDGEIHESVLLALYKQRREHPSDPGIVGWLLQEKLRLSDEHFEFHVWYLKSKGFLARTEQGTLAITIEGVDQVIGQSRNKREEQRLIGQSKEEPANAPNEG